VSTRRQVNSGLVRDERLTKVCDNISIGFAVNRPDAASRVQNVLRQIEFCALQRRNFWRTSIAHFSPSIDLNSGRCPCGNMVYGSWQARTREKNGGADEEDERQGDYE
jgi:hypothetical protein